MPRKTAIYSGSFNPLHIGHLAIIKYMIEEAGFDMVYLIVSPKNPLKDGISSATGTDRYKAAIEAEVAKAREEEGKLNNAITAETAAREEAVSGLTADIEAEADRALKAEGALAERVTDNEEAIAVLNGDANALAALRLKW